MNQFWEMNTFCRIWKGLVSSMLLVFFFHTATVHAQATDSIPRYQKLPFVPFFKLMRPDSSFFVMSEAVPKKKAAVVILFSPTCSHCRHQAEEITGHMQQLKDVTFLFVSSYPLAEIKQYIGDFGLDKFPNIQVGYDKEMNLISFYKVQGLPGIYVYDKKGKLAKTFSSNVTAEELVAALEN